MSPRKRSRFLGETNPSIPHALLNCEDPRLPYPFVQDRHSLRTPLGQGIVCGSDLKNTSPRNVRFRAKLLLRSWSYRKVLFCGLKFQLSDH